MSQTRWSADRVLIYRHPVHMLKQIDVLSELVGAEVRPNPADSTAYIFISQCSRRITVLIWHLDGHWLLYIDRSKHSVPTGKTGLPITRQ